MHYQNFKTVVYIPAQVAARFSKEKLEKDYSFLEKYIGLDKVYLETHRGNTDVEKEQILMIKEYLETQGVEVSGGITTVIPDFPAYVYSRASSSLDTTLTGRDEKPTIPCTSGCDGSPAIISVFP